MILVSFICLIIICTSFDRNLVLERLLVREWSCGIVLPCKPPWNLLQHSRTGDELIIYVGQQKAVFANGFMQANKQNYHFLGRFSRENQIWANPYLLGWQFYPAMTLRSACASQYGVVAKSLLITNCHGLTIKKSQTWSHGSSTSWEFFLLPLLGSWSDISPQSPPNTTHTHTLYFGLDTDQNELTSTLNIHPNQKKTKRVKNIIFLGADLVHYFLRAKVSHQHRFGTCSMQ